MQTKCRHILQVLGLFALSGALSACGGGLGNIDPTYGVAASPRVVVNGNVPSGGGRYQVGKPYKIAGRWYKPKVVSSYEKTGMASWYGDAFHGRKTANGEIFNMNALTAAHPTLPLPSYVRVTNLANKRSVIVRVNDRGPFAHNRLIDLSKKTAIVLDFKKVGVAKVHVRYIGPAPLEGQDEAFLMASASNNVNQAPVRNQAPVQNQSPRRIVASQQPVSAVNVAFRENSNASGGPLLIWGDDVPPVGSGYASMYSSVAK